MGNSSHFGPTIIERESRRVFSCITWHNCFGTTFPRGNASSPANRFTLGKRENENEQIRVTFRANEDAFHRHRNDSDKMVNNGVHSNPWTRRVNGEKRHLYIYIESTNVECSGAARVKVASAGARKAQNTTKKKLVCNMINIY